jgi:hypothetical protein
VKGLDISPAVHPQLTLEIWVKRRSNKNDREWILGHDNGGYDRAIALNDPRYGGVAGPNGGVAASPLGYLPLGRWNHVVVTYGQHAKTYLNGQLWDEGGANNNGGLPDFSIGGLTNFANHDVDAFISQVRVYDRELSNAEVQARFTDTLPRYAANFIRVSRNDLDRAAYRLGGYAGGGTWLTLDGAGRVQATQASAPPANAIVFYAYPVDATTENYLRFGQDFHLLSSDGRHLERLNRISSELPSQGPHYAARFDLQLVAQPTQTWRVDYADSGATGFVPNDAAIGLTIAGTNTNLLAPDNNDRNVVTVRPNDISVVVNWYQSDERLHLTKV